MDGYIARKTKNTSKAGAVLDSVADFIFIIIMLFIMIPIIDISFWTQVCLISIAIIKGISLLIGFVKYRSVSFLHTYMNKITGFLLFIFPVLYNIFGITITAFLLCCTAGIAAVEELAINLTSKELSYNIKSIFSK